MARKTHGLRRIRHKPLRGRAVRSLAKTTKGGKGRISKRSGYKRAMSKSLRKK